MKTRGAFRLTKKSGFDISRISSGEWTGFSKTRPASRGMLRFSKIYSLKVPFYSIFPLRISRNFCRLVLISENQRYSDFQEPTRGNVRTIRSCCGISGFFGRTESAPDLNGRAQSRSQGFARFSLYDELF